MKRVFLLFHRRGHPFLRQCTSDSAACDALVHAPTHRLVVISACSRYKAVNPACLYALFVRVHTFLQQIDSLCNATAKTGDLLDFYNILHNQRCLSDTESERRKQCRTDNITFYSFIYFNNTNIYKPAICNSGGGIFKEIFYPFLFGG